MPRKAQNAAPSIEAVTITPIVEAVTSTPIIEQAPPAPFSKTDTLIALLQRPNGVSLEELITTFGTQPHSIRAQVSVATRKRGLKVHCKKGHYTLVGR